jgi:hypothetical protein
MRGPVVIDTNLLALLVDGTTPKRYVSLHKRIESEFSIGDFELFVELVGLFSDIILLPHIIAETSSLIRQISTPMRTDIQDTLRKLITTTLEFPIASTWGARRDEYQELGITDAVILHFLSINEIEPTLMTIDRNLFNRANSLGYGVIDCRREFWPDRP